LFQSRFLCRIEKNGYDRDYCADNILYHNLLGVLILLRAKVVMTAGYISETFDITTLIYNI
ncbi:MAG: hypothetical protein MR545_07955, partial [Veillonellaceae bacterium]|nr:hypothetical protein [Veillonellaceae bacterium]